VCERANVGFNEKVVVLSVVFFLSQTKHTSVAALARRPALFYEDIYRHGTKTKTNTLEH
jgi:hypothetical protein